MFLVEEGEEEPKMPVFQPEINPIDRFQKILNN